MAERVTTVAKQSYAVDRISEAIRECESEEPNTERAAHMLRSALRVAFDAEPRTPNQQEGSDGNE